MILSRRVLLAGLALAGTKVTAFAQSAPEPQMIPVELIENALNLPSIVRLGHKHGDVIMVEYFDYNCPWCKRSAQALPDLLKAEPELTYVLVNFAVLSPQSVAATRAALAYLQLYGPERYLPLHLALFKLRGTVDGPRALSEAERLGGDTKRMTEIADSDADDPVDEGCLLHRQRSRPRRHSILPDRDGSLYRRHEPGAEARSNCPGKRVTRFFPPPCGEGLRVGVEKSEHCAIETAQGAYGASPLPPERGRIVQSAIARPVGPPPPLAPPRKGEGMVAARETTR